jgi:hypothetical protein
VGKTDSLLKNSVLPAAETGIASAKEKIDQVEFTKTVADAVQLSRAVMERLKLAKEAARSPAMEQLSHVDIQSGAADAL